MRIRRSLRLLRVLTVLLIVLPLMGRTETAIAQSSVIYDVPNDTTLFLPFCFDFMPDERYLLMAGGFGRGLRQTELRVWDFEMSEFILEHRLDIGESIHTLHVAPDGETLLLGTQVHDNVPENDNVWLWRMHARPLREGSPQLRSTVEPIRRLQTATRWYESLQTYSEIWGQAVFSDDANHVAVRRLDGVSGSRSVPTRLNHSIVILTTAGRVEETWELPSDQGYVFHHGGMQFSPSGAQIATTHVRTHYLGPPVPDDPSHDTISVELALWDVESGELVESRTVVDHEERPSGKAYHGWFDSLDYTSDGALIACDGPEFAVAIVDAQTLEPVRQLVGLTSCVETVAFSPDDTLVAAISSDKGDFCLWHAGTGELIFRNENPAIISEMRHLRVSPDGGKIVTRGTYRGEDNIHTEIRVWDVEQMRNGADN